MGVLDEAIRDHLELRRLHGASDAEIARSEAEALGPARRDPAADIFAEGDVGAAGEETTILDPVSEEDLGRPLVGDFPPAGPVDTEGETAVYNLEHDIRDAPVEEAPVEEAPVVEPPVTDEPPVEDEPPVRDEPPVDSSDAEDESPVRPAFPDDEPPPRPGHPDDEHLEPPPRAGQPEDDHLA